MGSNRSGRFSFALPSGRNLALGLAALVAGLAVSPRSTQDAIANGDTRTLTLHHTHTKETATVTFRKWGRYDSEALNQLNWLLRDWRRDEPTKMDPRLFDTLWEVLRDVGASGPIHVVSAYRSPETNAALRRRSRGVSEFSQHMRGKAMDFSLPDVSMARVREAGVRLQNGGVGFYPGAYNAFVHLDVGSVRAWPRLSRDQLARIFPNGKTVHLPSDGRPFERYEEAKAEILSRGGTVAGYAAYASAEEAVPGGGKSLWARLFGSDEDDDAALANAAPTPVATRRGRGGAAGATAVATAYAPSPSTESGDDRGFFATFLPKAEPAPVAAEPPRRGRSGRAGETQVASLDAASAEATEVARPAVVPLPPRRPSDLGVVMTADASPPRPRPIELASAGDMPLYASFAPRPPQPDTTVLAYAALPAARPADPVITRSAPPAAARAGDEERAQLKALFAAAASASAPSRTAPIATARAKAQPLTIASLIAADGATLSVGFSKAGADDLPPQRFSGPAVKPLAVLR